MSKSGEVKVSYIIVNLYAPCPNSQEKISFFEEIFELISDMEARHNSQNIIMAGDFNLNFNLKEMENRNFSAQENNVLKVVKQLANVAGLEDVWSESSAYTWRHPNTDVFSTIDSILINPNLMSILKLTGCLASLIMQRSNWISK